MTTDAELSDVEISLEKYVDDMARHAVAAVTKQTIAVSQDVLNDATLTIQQILAKFEVRANVAAKELAKINKGLDISVSTSPVKDVFGRPRSVKLHFAININKVRCVRDSIIEFS